MVAVTWSRSDPRISGMIPGPSVRHPLPCANARREELQWRPAKGSVVRTELRLLRSSGDQEAQPAQRAGGFLVAGWAPMRLPVWQAVDEKSASTIPWAVRQGWDRRRLRGCSTPTISHEAARPAREPSSRFADRIPAGGREPRSQSGTPLMQRRGDRANARRDNGEVCKGTRSCGGYGFL